MDFHAIFSFYAFRPTDAEVNPSLKQDEPPSPEDQSQEPSLQDISTMTNKQLLMDPFELTTNERKRTQIALLSEVLLDIKVGSWFVVAC